MKLPKPGKGLYLCLFVSFLVTVVLYFSLLIPFFVLAYIGMFFLLIGVTIRKLFSPRRSN